MPRLKKERLEADQRSHDVAVVVAACIDVLTADVIANIFGFLPPQDIMRSRLNKKMRKAAKETIAPPTKFVVDSTRSYNAMKAMTTALPNLQHISINRLEHRYRYVDGLGTSEILTAFSEMLLCTSKSTVLSIGILEGSYAN